MINVKTLFTEYQRTDERYIMIAQDRHKYGMSAEFLAELSEAAEDLDRVARELREYFNQGEIDRLARMEHPLRLANPVYRNLVNMYEADRVSPFLDAYQAWEALAQDLWRHCEDEEYVSQCVDAENALIDAWARLTAEDINELGEHLPVAYLVQCGASWGYPSAHTGNGAAKEEA